MADGLTRDETRRLAALDRAIVYWGPTGAATPDAVIATAEMIYRWLRESPRSWGLPKEEPNG